MIKNFTIGTDAELFVQNRQTGEIVSAEGYAKGTKQKPYVFDKSSPFFATSLDNVLFEFCIPPARTAKEFVDNINKSKMFVGSQLPEHLCYAPLASAQLADKFLRTKNAKMFGCEPDINAWTGMFNDPPDAMTNLRSAGFHVHVGFQGSTMQVIERLVKTMDLFLGVPSLIIDPDNNRRRLYGKAGAFRQKEYGFEYRVLSGYFSSSDRLSEWVFNNTERAIDYVNNDGQIDDQIPFIIDMNDKDRAQQTIEAYNIPLP